MRTCAKLRCRTRATATATLRYGAREVILDELSPDPEAALVDLCREHAERLTPPIGWRIVDARVPAPLGGRVAVGLGA